ncbi:hypothetical protein [Hymenobacter terricola]|uniref:hypothetical protein n=1 Tax=Hymenobacter terricola TaxID=2819236 RepID=UPI001B307E20|nr:hypothetical protein [Hymenobacter terricola]
MAFEFKNILSALGLKNSTDPVTEAHLQAADDKIALLEQEKTAADTRATQAEAARVAAQTALDTAKDEATASADKLKAAEEKTATLEDWKQKQKAVDGRQEDDSNDLDTEDEGPKASWEVAASKAIASVKRRVGEK